MGTPSKRSFSIFDGLVLLAATMLGLAWSRGVDELRDLGPYGVAVLANHRGWIGRGWFLLKPYSACLASWTIAVAALALRKPRPDLARLVLQPGVAACFAACLALAVEAARAAHLTLRMIVLNGWSLNEKVPLVGDEGWHAADSMIPRVIPQEIALAVAVAGLLLVLGKLWHPALYWIDRVGRILAILWVFFAVLAALEIWAVGVWP